MPLDIKCRKCLTAAGWACRTKQGKPAPYFHEIRRYDATKEKK